MLLCSFVDCIFNLVISFKIEFYACGLTSADKNLVVLGIEDFSISVRMFAHFYFSICLCVN